MMSRHEGTAEKRPIVFIGTMNAMPMMYALELRSQGFDVFYVVDVPQSDTLSRPENHYPEISYPYPDWIIELVLPTQMIAALTPRALIALLWKKLRRAGMRGDPVIITGGFHHRLLACAPKRSVKVALTFGADLDTWSHSPGADKLAIGFRDRSIFKFLPAALARRLIKSVVANQFAALGKADAVIYFARGLNANGDTVTDALERSGVNVVRRHDVSFRPLAGTAPWTRRPHGEPLTLLSPVRFTFRTFAEGSPEYNKGNDEILAGIAEFARLGVPFKLHVFEKGEDVGAAKELIASLGLQDHVVWHQQMPFYDLLRLYEQADIVFDQVGQHWIGAIGMYALHMGIPLIANASNLVATGIIPAENPIFNATNAEEVCRRLTEIVQQPEHHWGVERSRQFAATYFGPARVTAEIARLAGRESR